MRRGRHKCALIAQQWCNKRPLTGPGKVRANQGGKWRGGRTSAHLLQSKGEHVRTYCAVGTGLGKERAKQGGKWRKGQTSAYLLRSRGEQVRTCCAAEANAHLLRSRNGKGRTSAHLLRTNAYAYMGRTGFRFYIRFSAAHKCVLMAISAHLWGLAEAGIRTHGLGDSRGIYRRAKRHAFFF